MFIQARMSDCAKPLNLSSLTFGILLKIVSFVPEHKDSSDLDELSEKKKKVYWLKIPDKVYR